MIDSHSYYQATLQRRYYDGKMSREKMNDAIEQNRRGKKMGKVIMGRKIRISGTTIPSYD